MWIAIGRFLGAFFAISAIAGCGASGPPDEPVSTAMPEWMAERYGGSLPGMKVPSADQARVLQDLPLTRDEYLDAFRKYQTCAGEAGYSITVTDWDSPVLAYRGSGGGNEAEMNCYGEHFMYVDMEWQGANEDLTEVIENLNECLSARGYEPTREGAEPLPNADHQPRYRALREQAREAGIADQCAAQDRDSATADEGNKE